MYKMIKVKKNRLIFHTTAFGDFKNNRFILDIGFLRF